MYMNDYYKYRKKFRELYDKEPYSNNDIGSKILEIKDKNKSVISISLNLNVYYIEVQFEEGTSIEKIDKVLNYILKIIGNYISSNIDYITDITSEEKNEIRKMILNFTICDYIVIGNMIKINL